MRADAHRSSIGKQIPAATMTDKAEGPEEAKSDAMP